MFVSCLIHIITTSKNVSLLLFFCISLVFSAHHMDLHYRKPQTLFPLLFHLICSLHLLFTPLSPLCRCPPFKVLLRDE